MKQTSALVRESETRAIRRAADSGTDDDDGHSDVFLVGERASGSGWSITGDPSGVTLFVYGWDNVEPGPLSWEFPNLDAALRAVRTMRNAVAWCIAEGRETSPETARASGAILVEQIADA